MNNNIHDENNLPHNNCCGLFISFMPHLIVEIGVNQLKVANLLSVTSFKTEVLN